MTENPKPVLVLGGSTFMGKSLLEKLNSNPKYKTFYINRGRKYWSTNFNIGIIM